jgi:hypothetical protein
MKARNFPKGVIDANIKALVALVLTPSRDDIISDAMIHGVDAEIRRDYQVRQQNGKCIGDSVIDLPDASLFGMALRGVPGPLRRRMD